MPSDDPMPEDLKMALSERGENEEGTSYDSGLTLDGVPARNGVARRGPCVVKDVSGALFHIAERSIVEGSAYSIGDGDWARCDSLRRAPRLGAPPVFAQNGDTPRVVGTLYVFGAGN